MRSNNDCIKFFFLYFSNRLLMRSKNSDNQRACDRKSSTSKSNSLYLTENFVMIFLELSSLLQILELFSFFFESIFVCYFFRFLCIFSFHIFIFFTCFRTYSKKNKDNVKYLFENFSI